MWYLPSGRIYIGQSVNIKSRWRKYLSCDCNKQKLILRSLTKYGAKKHKFEIIEQCLPKELNNREKYYVDLFQTFNSEYGMNLKDGGGNKTKPSEETKKRMSDAHKGKKMSEETKEKLRKINTGKKMSEAAIIKIRKAVKGRRCSEKTKEKLRKIRTGKKHSEETKIKLKKAWETRKPQTPETKEKISIALKGRKLSEEHRSKLKGRKHGKNEHKRIRSGLWQGGCR